MLIFEKIKVFLNFRQTRFGWVFFHRKFYRNKFSLQYSLLLRQNFQYRNSDVIAIFSKRLYTIVLCLKLILKLYRKLVSYLLQTETLKKFWRKKNYGEFDPISSCSYWTNIIPCWAKSVKESSEVADKAIFSPLNRWVSNFFLNSILLSKPGLNLKWFGTEIMLMWRVKMNDHQILYFNP